jgi:hypothetical protein
MRSQGLRRRSKRRSKMRSAHEEGEDQEEEEEEEEEATEVEEEEQEEEESPPKRAASWSLVERMRAIKAEHAMGPPPSPATRAPLRLATNDLPACATAASAIEL